MTDMKLILASGSAARKMMLREAGYEFDIIPADIDEQKFIDEAVANKTSFEKIALILAQEKAQAVCNEQNKESIIVGSDQLLIFEDEIMTKSKNLEQAKEKLMKMQGKEHQLISAVYAKTPTISFMSEDSATLVMKHLSEVQIDEYLQSAPNDALQCVGGYAIEGKGRALFDDVRGDDYTIMGMPLPKLQAFLERQGFKPSKVGAP